METEKILLKEEFPVSALKLYNAWLDNTAHEAFTGGGLVSIENKKGSQFTAWNGYISGEILELEDGKRILHSWRTTEFPDLAENSFLEITLENSDHGCNLILNHWNIPNGQGEDYKKGWIEFYFKPMKEYFKNNSKN